MEDFFRDFFGRIEYCVPVRTTHFQTDRRKNQLVMMVQRACVCMPARRLGVGRTRRSASVDSGLPVSIRSAGWLNGAMRAYHAPRGIVTCRNYNNAEIMQHPPRVGSRRAGPGTRDGDSGSRRERAAAAAPQCATFTGIIPVLALFLIKFEWYWYLVFEVVFEVF